ncbi:MAG: hypothetical protein WCN87_02750 [Chlamydiota bacterium]
MKKIVAFFLLLNVAISAQTQSKAATKGLFSDVNISTTTALGLTAVVGVAAAILIYNSNTSH